MRIERPHNLGRQAAIDRVDRVVDRLLQQKPPGGVTIENPSTSWSGGRMDFSFRASKGFFGATIGGTVDVEDDRVILDVNVPPLVRSFLGEDRIRETVTRELDRLLASP